MACNNTFTQEQKNHILMALSGTGLVSFIMCVITVSLVFWLRLHKHFIYRLAMYQVISSLFFSIAEILSLTLLNYNGDTFDQISCKIDAFLIEYLLWVKLLFTICLSFHFFGLAVCLKDFRKFELAYVLFSIICPLLFTWIPFIHNSYDIAGAWCWIRNWKDNCATRHYIEGITEQFVLWYGPLFFFLTITVIGVFIMVAVLAWRACKKNTSNSENEALLMNQQRSQHKKALKELLPLLAYPVLFYVLCLFPLINRIYDAISNNGNYFLAIAQCVTNASWGFFSSLALLAHLFLIRSQKKNREQAVHTLPSTNDGTIVYTNCSTMYRTRYSIVGESEIDNAIGDSQVE